MLQCTRVFALFTLRDSVSVSNSQDEIARDKNCERLENYFSCDKNVNTGIFAWNLPALNLVTWC